ncbi:MAG: hypothetical protein PUP93_17660 [Rhizonema sp. NSF051]|nr:hypothetical protein [Rhizonema sp. NSF051]
MADTSLTKTDLMNLVTNLLDVVGVSTEHRGELLRKNQINREQNAEFFDLELRLLSLANRAANSAINEVLTDIKDAGEALTETTKHLQTVIDKLNSFGSFFDTLAKLVNVFSRITQAITGGTTAIIEALVQELNNIGSRGLERVSLPGQINEV